MDSRRSADEVRRRTVERSALCLALLLAACACAYLTSIVRSTQWGMDADEAVHAVEALRLHDRAENGELLGFARDAWMPERWQPPVNPHIRWYPPVHAIATVPFLGVFGRTDFAARAPSIVFLFGSVLIFFELARRLAPRRQHGPAAGVCAAALLLAAPNVLTFSAQSLTEPASLFFSFLALLLYVVSLERGHPWGRAIAAGAALGVAMLTKYDHGGLLALALGLAEVVRARGRIDRMVRTGPIALFGLPLLAIVLWFAGADKIDALKDSVSHPFAGSGRLVFLDFFLTWIVEYGSSIAMGALAVLALLLGWRARDPAVRAVWFWAVLTALFLGIRSRFHFRYNFVEAPAALLLLGVLLPGAVERVAGRLRAARGARAWWALGGLGLILAAGGGFCAIAPDSAFDLLRRPFAWVYGLRADHFGLTLEPDAYVDHFALEYRAAALYLGSSFAALGVGLAVLGAGGVVLTAQPSERAFAAAIVWTALGAATLPGVVRLYAELPGMVDWELECHPEIDVLQGRVTELAEGLPRDGTPRTILLGGGWDQLTNNGLRWHILSRGDRDARYADVEVWGDMIGSLVFPPEPRIRHWAEVLGTETGEALPDAIALVDSDPERFLYRTRMGPEVAIYRDLLVERGGYRLVQEERFPALNADLLLYVREGQPGARADFQAALARHGIEPDTEGNASRVLISEAGWSLRDESLRHFIRR